ncbi:hypothetical protein [Streptomyces virginiae]|uniref:hypothetical protein n=1 Tax=Streptomyces virginiae TaxID=1961 RepID=UPI00366720D2
MNFTRYRKPSAIALLTVGTALAVTAVAGLSWSHEGGLVLLLRVYEHVVLLGWLALAALTGAVLLGMHRSTLRLPLLTTLLICGVPLLLLGTFVSTVFGDTSREEKTEAAPGRDDRRLVVERGGFLDPVWCVYVHEGSRPLERRWIVGCFNGDSDRNELRETVWTAPDRIRMTTSGGAVHEVTLAPGGRPDRTVSVG